MVYQQGGGNKIPSNQFMPGILFYIVFRRFFSPQVIELFEK
jgi:hypothetical protein